jgi:uncharacterized membrane protein
LGIPIIVVASCWRLNPMLSSSRRRWRRVPSSGDFTRVVSALGKAFNANRLIMIPWSSCCR